MIAIVSASLSSDSNSRLLAQEAKRALERQGHTVGLIDLREYPLPFCGGEATDRDLNVTRIRERLRPANAIIVATPIYNFDVSAALKNLIELTGDAWEDKTVGFLCAAGGQNSYMSVLAFANSLMLDFRCLIVPRFVYATGKSFTAGRLHDPEVSRRIAELAQRVAQLAGAVQAHAA